MSAALESLMIRDVPRPAPAAPVFSGVVAFAGIGVAAALTYVVLSTLLLWLHTGIADWVINTACYGGLIVPVYLLHRRYSFDSDAPHMQALPRYMAVQAMALLLAALFSYVVHGVFAMPPLWASVVVIGLTSGVNFIVLRSWAFARTQWEASLA